jgi:hypothetical protein
MVVRTHSVFVAVVRFASAGSYSLRSTVLPGGARQSRTPPCPLRASAGCHWFGMPRRTSMEKT